MEKNLKTQSRYQVRDSALCEHTYVELTSLANSAGFAAVHVTVVNKSAKIGMAEASSSTAHDKGITGCQCSVM